MGCCGDDKEEEVPEMPERLPRTRLQWLLVRCKAVVFLAMSIYTIVSLFEALEAVSRDELQLSDTPPSDRCIPFFDEALKLKDNAPNVTFNLYDWRTGTAELRVCTEQSDAVIDEHLVKRGGGVRFDPWRDQTGCDVLGTDNAAFKANCEFQNWPAGWSTNCADVLDIGPAPFGVHWLAYAQRLTGNKSDGVTPYPHCSIRMKYISSDISNCTLTRMVPAKKEDKAVEAVLIFAVIVPFACMIGQCVAIWKYREGGWKATDGWMLAWAQRGVPGPAYELWWWTQEAKEPKEPGNEGPTGAHFGEFPDEVWLTWPVFGAVIVQDAIEGLAAPLTAILGCTLDRFPQQLALLAIKCAKVLYEAIYFYMHYGEDAEPGSWEDQQQFEAEYEAKRQELIAEKRGPVHTSTTAV